MKRILKAEDEQEDEPPAEQVSGGFTTKLRHHANGFGSISIFLWRILRLLAVLGLVGLAVVTLISAQDVTLSIPAARFLNWSVLGTYVRIRLFAGFSGSHSFTALRVCLGSNCRINASENREPRKHPPHLDLARRLARLQLQGYLPSRDVHPRTPRPPRGMAYVD